jgi:3-phenylpropionate/trans-cinnamate dioxygenase ferredoxin reductase subunit
MAGLPNSNCIEVVRGDPNSAACCVYSFRGNKLASVESLNRAADHMLARRLLTGRIAVTPEQAADTHFDLKSLLPTLTSAVVQRD